MQEQDQNTARIRELNDLLRTSFIGGKVLQTLGIQNLPESEQSKIIEKVEAFNDFTDDNDPYKEHDFGAFTHAGNKIFWKIDYYDPTMSMGGEDPSDQKQTMRVLTIMLAEEY